MKTQLLSGLLVLSTGALAPAASSLPAGLSAARSTTTSGTMMIVSRILFTKPQASILIISPDGQEQEVTEGLKALDLNSFGVKRAAQNIVAVNKVALQTVNKYQAEGWQLQSVAPNDVVNGGSTMVSQTTYYLTK